MNAAWHASHALYIDYLYFHFLRTFIFLLSPFSCIKYCSSCFSCRFDRWTDISLFHLMILRLFIIIAGFSFLSLMLDYAHFIIEYFQSIGCKCRMSWWLNRIFRGLSFDIIIILIIYPAAALASSHSKVARITAFFSLLLLFLLSLFICFYTAFLFLYLHASFQAFIFAFHIWCFADCFHFQDDIGR